MGLFLTGCVNQNNELSIESSEPVSSEIVSSDTYSSSSVHEHAYRFSSVYVRDSRDPNNYRGNINVNGHYLIRFDYDTQITYDIL